MNKRFRQKAVETTAEIYAVEKRTGARSTYYIVQLKYKTIDEQVEYKGQTVFSNRNKVKDIIPLWYKANDPSIFKTDEGKWLRWALLFAVLFFGLICWLCIWLMNLEVYYSAG